MLLPIQDEAWYDQVLYLPTWFLDLPDFEFDWEATVYGNVHEDIPKDISAPLVYIVTFSNYVDANLYHDMTLGNS